MADNDQKTPNGQEPVSEVSQAETEDWKAKAAEYKDKWLRTAADFDNYVKRQQRDRQKQETELRIRVIKKLLPTLDDLERALKNTPPELVDNAWVQGVILIERKFRSILDDFDIKPIDAVGKMFDPTYHEALMTEASELPEGTILEEYQKGYTLDDQIVRVTSVKTSSGPAKN